MNDRISVIIPTIPRRDQLLARAIKSVYSQSRVANEVCVALDSQGFGAARTRQQALDMADPRNDWVAFLDDDDEFLPQHLERLYAHGQNTHADYVFSYFVRAQGGDPLGHFGKPWNPADPHQTTITTLVKRELAQEVGFYREAEGDEIHGQKWGEDFTFTLGCMNAGANIVHLAEETWIWTRHSGNSSGQPGRGDA